MPGGYNLPAENRRLSRRTSVVVLIEGREKVRREIAPENNGDGHVSVLVVAGGSADVAHEFDDAPSWPSLVRTRYAEFNPTRLAFAQLEPPLANDPDSACRDVTCPPLHKHPSRTAQQPD